MVKRNYILDLMDEKPVDAKGALIAAAIREIAMRSIEGARMREIAKRAGVNHACINYYFGGKEALYREIVSEIADAINRFNAAYYRQAKEIERSRSAVQARDLLLRFLMDRVRGSSSNPVYADIFLIIAKEELYPTNAFDGIYKDAFVRMNKMGIRMVEIASKGRVSGQRARLLAFSLVGQVQIFLAAKQGVLRINRWKALGKKECDAIQALVKHNLDRILK